MPHVRRSMLITVDARRRTRARRARRRARARRRRATDAFDGPIVGMPDTSRALIATIVELVEPGYDAACSSRRTSDVRVPFFTWFLRFQAWLGARRALPTPPPRLDRGRDRRRAARRR